MMMGLVNQIILIYHSIQGTLTRRNQPVCSGSPGGLRGLKDEWVTNVITKASFKKDTMPNENVRLGYLETNEIRQ